MKKLLTAFAIFFGLLFMFGFTTNITTVQAQERPQSVLERACSPYPPADNTTCDATVLFTVTSTIEDEFPHINDFTNISYLDFTSSDPARPGIIYSYCYSGWCRFPGEEAETFGQSMTIEELQRYNEAIADNEKTGSVSVDSTMRAKGSAFLAWTANEIISSDEETGSTVGVLPTVTTLIGELYGEPAASSQIYIADLMQDLSIAQPAHAQGIGFSALEPILETWKIFRNVAYLFFIVVFLIIGFMIMFRQKIGGQSAVTVQQALPKIIVALITVTFSYAIAGLLIDIMYLSMYFIAGLFEQGNVEAYKWLNPNVFGITFQLLGEGAAIKTGTAVEDLVVNSLGGRDTGLVTQSIGWISHLTALVVVLLVILFNTFKLFISLMKVYVEILVAIIFAPLYLMMGAIPGRNSFGTWLKMLIANLAVFPTILLLLLLYETLTQFASSSPDASVGFSPPYFLGTGASHDVIGFLAGMALILAMPQAVDDVRKALGAGQTGIFGSLMKAGLDAANKRKGAGLGFGMGVVGSGYGALGGAIAATPALFGNNGMTARQRARAGISRVAKGAAMGAVLPGAAPTAYRAGKSIASHSLNQVGQTIGTSAFETGQNTFMRYRANQSATAGANNENINNARQVDIDRQSNQTGAVTGRTADRMYQNSPTNPDNR